MRWIISRKNETLQQLWQWLCHASKSMWLLCQIISYLEADSYTSAIRNAISLGGDADTMACMAGGIAVVVKKWSCVIGTALLPDMDDFTICWLYEWKKYGK